jgi:hypothetical protein
MQGKGTLASPYKVSPSMLGKFLDCSSCFIAKHVGGLKQPSGPMAMIAGGLDRSLRRIMEGHHAAGVMPADFAAVPELSGYELASRDFVSGFLSVDQSDYIDVNGLIFKLHGALDELFVRTTDDGSEEFLVADYKSKYGVDAAQKDPHPAFVRQLRLYAYILRSNGHQVSNTALLLNYYPTETEVVDEVHPVLQFLPYAVDVSPSTITPLLADIQTMVTTFATQNATGTTLPKNPDCKWCDYRA